MVNLRMSRINYNMLCFSEGYLYNKDQNKEIYNSLLQHSKVIQVDRNYFKFVVTGFVVLKDKLIVVFPKNYTIPKDYLQVRKEAALLFKTLMKYRSEKHHNDEEIELLYGGDNLTSTNISSAVHIVYDYVKYGLLKRNVQRKAALRNGRIDWTATIVKTSPCCNHGKPAYLYPIMNTIVSDPHSIVTKIHRYVVQECCELWGWLTGYDSIKFDDIAVMPVSISEAIAILKHELLSTYVQREIEVIKSLIDYLDTTAGNAYRNKLNIIATPYFHYVWESVCNCVFESQYHKLSHMIPQPKWESKIVKASVSQRPDTLFLHGNIFYIFDAKYYNYNSNLPGWHDIVKQLFYKVSLEKALRNPQYSEVLQGVNELVNVFVLPDNSESYIKFIGLVDVSELPELGCVYAFSLNTKQALAVYANEDSSSIKEDMISAINIEKNKASV